MYVFSFFVKNDHVYPFFAGQSIDLNGKNNRDVETNNISYV